MLTLSATLLFGAAPARTSLERHAHHARKQVHPTLRFHLRARRHVRHAKPPVHHRRIRRLPRATPSSYVHSTRTNVLWQKGCRAWRHRAFGIVILAFGKPYYDGHSYGTLTFSNRFASNRRITTAMKALARGYVRCLPRRSRAHIVFVTSGCATPGRCRRSTTP